MAGRPRKEVNVEQIETLARIHCTYEEIAAVTGVSTKTLQRNYVHLIEKGREEGKASLRRIQFKKALEGHPTMMIWLGKQYLDQKDKREDMISIEEVETLAVRRRSQNPQT
jgi:hypothetical protein